MLKSLSSSRGLENEAMKQMGCIRNVREGAHGREGVEGFLDFWICSVGVVGSYT